jgi:hypothetical protein
MKNSTPVKLEVGAPEPSRSVRVIVLTDKLSERIGARGLPRQRLKLQKFRSHRFTPEIQVRSMAPPRTLNSEGAATGQKWLEARQRHRSILFS